MKRTSLDDWGDKLKTNVPEMDHHHQRLIDIFNSASSHLRSGGDAIALSTIVSDLVAYSIYHFDMEESLMKLHGYGDSYPEELTAHVHQHRVFMGKVAAFRDDLKAGAEIDPWTVLDFLNAWLLDHIAGTDKQLARFILASTGQV